MDCANLDQGRGCDGGWYDYGWTYANEQHGLSLEGVYPYMSKVSLVGH